MHGFVGVELPVASMATAQLRRAPDDGPGNETEGRKGQMSAVSTVVAVEGSERRGEQRLDELMLDVNLGSGGLGKMQGSSGPAAAAPPSW